MSEKKNKKTSPTLRHANEFEKLTPHQHALKRPDMWLGSMESVSRKCRTFSASTKRFGEIKTKVPFATEKVFVEVLNNAGDGILIA